MPKAKIFVAGHKGMVGSSIVKLLSEKGQKNIITKSHAELDLTKQNDVVNFFKKKKLTKFIWLLQKLEVFMPTQNIQQNLFTKI